ncbi:aldehyde dehydrogenase (NADP(+)) [Parachryseolinea silvisoli]|uniref:aldehyde dehydrogenase (NADP(+)) n=1 Tax=Parachryseolinea silvisoli TaxID=2873601 RepID=UPI002265AE6F|nr:aldehyde dehydrogenase (NADP(+)) [Parachryseolinea silvisoli]MCD9017648.1 aldehyde dehydrogenase (NADP(+)) [Parachryseolinea silvisoli]
MIPIEGNQLIGFKESGRGSEFFQSANPATGAPLPYHFAKATADELHQACEKASEAFQQYRKATGATKAAFLEAIAVEIKSLGDQLIEICNLETALPKPRLEGERDRTVSQLLMFAGMLREGSWIGARIDTANPMRTPLPKPDLRTMHLGLGPVAVFGASNFPLAFSVAGGDTAAAFAAGCSVIVKAHEAHPATSELVGKAIVRAAKATNMPDGIFSLLHGHGNITGIQLVKNKHIKAVGFTGSFTAGKALSEAVAQRDEPIPVYAEMGSINPVFILPRAMQAASQKIAQGFAASVTLGTGQFCTNPGLLVYEENEPGRTFQKYLTTEFGNTSGGPMLTANILRSYTNAITRHITQGELEVLARGKDGPTQNCALPILFKTTGAVFAQHPALAEEVFGPTSMIVSAASRNEVLSIARTLSGHLTATVHGTDEDLDAYRELLDILEQKVGRVVINGFPTGVEVSHAMVHGGPYPATTDGRSTSVGTASIFRFTRAVCYQNMPQGHLPAELQDNNPLGIWRLLNGEQTRESIK